MIAFFALGPPFLDAAAFICSFLDIDKVHLPC